MAYATVEEMSTLRPGGISVAEEPRAEALLEEASVLIDEEVGLEALLIWAQPDAVVPRAIKSVCIQVALRVFDNPNGLSMEQATGYMYQKPQGTITGLELTKAEKSRVRKVAGRASGYSVRTPTGVDEFSMETTAALDEV